MREEEARDEGTEGGEQKAMEDGGSAGIIRILHFFSKIESHCKILSKEMSWLSYFSQDYPHYYLENRIWRLRMKCGGHFGDSCRWTRIEVTVALRAVAMKMIRDEEIRDKFLIHLLMLDMQCEKKTGKHRKVGTLRKDAAVGQICWGTISTSVGFEGGRLIEEHSQE